jgi:glucose-1-phosphate adenylyltransferase
MLLAASLVPDEMGVYVFRARSLYQLLDANPGSDFGKDIIPASLESCQVMAYPFDGYWEDIGTIRAFYDANLALMEPHPLFDFHDADRPIYTHPRFLPPGWVDGDCRLNRALLAPGARVVGSDIHHSIVGVRSQIGPACRLSHTIMMGADFFESDADKAANAAAGRPNVGIGANCVIDGAIIDKNARIGSDTVIRPLAGRPDFDADNYAVRDGIVVVMKNATIGRARSFRPPTNLLRARRWVENPDAPAPGSARLPAPATKNPRPARDSNSSAP